MRHDYRTAKVFGRRFPWHVGSTHSSQPGSGTPPGFRRLTDVLSSWIGTCWYMMSVAPALIQHERTCPFLIPCLSYVFSLTYPLPDICRVDTSRSLYAYTGQPGRKPCSFRWLSGSTYLLSIPLRSYNLHPQMVVTRGGYTSNTYSSRLSPM